MPLDPRLALAGVPAIVEPLDFARPLLAASQLRSQGLSQHLAQSQLAERAQNLAEDEQIRGLFALGQPQAHASAAAPQPTAATPGPLVENGQVVPPRVGEGLSPALAQGAQGPTFQQRLMAINPRRGLEYRQKMAEAESAENKAREERLEYLGTIAYAITQSDTQEAYDAGIGELRRTLGNEAVDAMNLPAVYNKKGVLDFYGRMTSEANRLKGQRQIGLQTTPGVDAQGNPVLIQPSTTGEGVVMALPPGVRPAPAATYKDTGTEIVGLDRSGQIISRTPKDIAGVQREQALGGAATQRLKDLDKQGQTATDTMRQLAELEKVLSAPEGIYERALTDRAQLKAYETGVWKNDPRAQNTLKLRQIGAALVSAQGLGAQVSDADRTFYEKAVGDLNNATNEVDARNALDRLLRVTESIRRDADRQRARYERTGRFEPFSGGSGQGSQSPAPGQQGTGRDDLSRLTPEKQARYQELRQKYGGR